MRRFVTLCVFLLSSVYAFSQTRTITGTVTDEGGQPLEGVSVVVSGSAIGTTTGMDGRYSLAIPANARSITFSFLGYNSQTVNLTAANVYSVALQLGTATGLEEVVITGVSRVKRSEFTGATTKLSEKQIEDKPVGSLDQIFQGRIPGVLALTGSGQPGNPSTIIIRGQGSISGGSSPLYIVDGIPVEAGVFQGLNPNDFESVDILRDAASAALYGSRGSSGVIVITTKRGKAGKVKVGYNGQVGFKSKPDFAFRPMNTKELLQAQEDYGKIVGATADNPGLPGWYYSKNNPRYSTMTPAQQAQADQLLDSISRIDTDWTDEIYRQGRFSNHELVLSGGTGKTRIYSSLALYNEQGTTLRTDMNRVTLRNNVDHADDRFSFSFSSTLAYTRRSFQQSSDWNTSNPFAISALAVPYHKPYKDDGSYFTGTGTKFVATNQLDQTYWDRNYNDQIKATVGITTSYRVINDLSVNLTTGIDFRETQNSNYGSPRAYTRVTSTSITGKAGFMQEGLTRYLLGNVRPSVTYSKSFDRSDLEVTALGEYVVEYDKSFVGTGYGVDPKRPNTIASVTPGNAVNQLYQSITGGKGANTLVSGLAMARYTFDNKYTVSGSYRSDGSSKLPVATRWQEFYAIGATWNVSREEFMRNIDAINTLVLKLSYGGSGNSNNFPRGNYPYQATYTQGTYSGLNTIVATYAGNPAMKWETTYTTNLGLDFGLFRNRIWGSVNFYDRRTKDLFVSKPLSASAGFGVGASIDVNAGELQNKGVELELNGDLIRSRDLVWSVFGNFAYNKNEVLDLGGQSEYERGTSRIVVGLPLGSHYEVKWGGVDAATGAPLYYTKDGKLTNVYNADDAVQEFGTWEAPWKGGFGTNLSYKGIGLSVLFSWQHGATKVDNLEYFLENPTGFMAPGYNQSSSLDFWKKPGDVARNPSPLYSVNFSSLLIHDASFMRLREVTLSYDFQNSLLRNTSFLSKARFFVQGNNLFLWTKWRGRDPEAGAVNINISEFPNPRAVTAGLQLTF